jgi:hypothetical protein
VAARFPPFVPQGDEGGRCEGSEGLTVKRFEEGKDALIILPRAVRQILKVIGFTVAKDNGLESSRPRRFDFLTRRLRLDPIK